MKFKLLKQFDEGSIDVGEIFETQYDKFVTLGNDGIIDINFLIREGYIEKFKMTTHFFKIGMKVANKGGDWFGIIDCIDESDGDNCYRVGASWYSFKDLRPATSEEIENYYI